MTQGFIDINGKKFFQSGTFKVEAYPELTNKDEAIKLLINARDTFFGLAQDGIGIPPYIFNEDKSGYLQGRRTVVETVLKGRKQLLEECRAKGNAEEIRAASAKYVGAIVEMMGVLGEEVVTFSYGNQKEEIQKLRTIMEPLLIQAYDLLDNVRLKGNVSDMDGVLRAQLGETVKAAIIPDRLDFVHQGDYVKIIGAMRDVTAISQWMDEQIPKSEDFVAVRKALSDYSKKVIERLGVRREDQYPEAASGGLPRRDRMEVEIEGLKDRLVEMLDAVQGKRTNTSGHIRRGSELMYDMIKQGEKPVSTYLVFSIRHADSIGDQMKKLAALNPPLRHLAEPIAKLTEAAGTHLRKALRDGSYRDCRQADFVRAKTDLIKAIDDIAIPMVLRHDEIDRLRACMSQLKSGLDLLEKTMPDLSAGSHISNHVQSSNVGHIRRMASELTAEVRGWCEKTAALSSVPELQ